MHIVYGTTPCEGYLTGLSETLVHFHVGMGEVEEGIMHCRGPNNDQYHLEVYLWYMLL